MPHHLPIRTLRLPNLQNLPRRVVDDTTWVAWVILTMETSPSWPPGTIDGQGVSQTRVPARETRNGWEAELGGSLEEGLVRGTELYSSLQEIIPKLPSRRGDSVPMGYRRATDRSRIALPAQRHPHLPLLPRHIIRPSPRLRWNQAQISHRRSGDHHSFPRPRLPTSLRRRLVKRKIP